MELVYSRAKVRITYWDQHAVEVWHAETATYVTGLDLVLFGAWLPNDEIRSSGSRTLHAVPLGDRVKSITIQEKVF